MTIPFHHHDCSISFRHHARSSYLHDSSGSQPVHVLSLSAFQPCCVSAFRPVMRMCGASVQCARFGVSACDKNVRASVHVVDGMICEEMEMEESKI